MVHKKFSCNGDSHKKRNVIFSLFGKILTNSHWAHIIIRLVVQRCLLQCLNFKARSAWHMKVAIIDWTHCIIISHTHSHKTIASIQAIVQQFCSALSSVAVLPLANVHTVKADTSRLSISSCSLDSYVHAILNASSLFRICAEPCWQGTCTSAQCTSTPRCGHS